MKVVKLQLAGRVLDEQTLESTYTREELSDLWRPVLLAPGGAARLLDELPLARQADSVSTCAQTAFPLSVRPGYHSASLPMMSAADMESSWIGSLSAAGGPCSSFLLSVQDHQMCLEDTEEALSSVRRPCCNPSKMRGMHGLTHTAPRPQREKEDAANEFMRDANLLSREEAVCCSCKFSHTDIPFQTLQLICKQCKTATMLPPAAPLVMRSDEPGHLLFEIHGEKSDRNRVLRSLLSDGGVYHLQWREVDPSVQEFSH